MEQYIGDILILVASVLIAIYMLWDRLFPQ
jgi:hypothetical protein